MSYFPRLLPDSKVGVFVQYRAIREIAVKQQDVDQGIPHSPPSYTRGIPHCAALHDTGISLASFCGTLAIRTTTAWVVHVHDIARPLELTCIPLWLTLRNTSSSVRGTIAYIL